MGGVQSSSGISQRNNPCGGRAIQLHEADQRNRTSHESPRPWKHRCPVATPEFRITTRPRLLASWRHERRGPIRIVGTVLWTCPWTFRIHTRAGPSSASRQRLAGVGLLGQVLPSDAKGQRNDPSEPCDTPSVAPLSVEVLRTAVGAISGLAGLNFPFAEVAKRRSRRATCCDNPPAPSAQ